LGKIKITKQRVRADFTNYVYDLPLADYSSYLGNEKPAYTIYDVPFSQIRCLVFPAAFPYDHTTYDILTKELKKLMIKKKETI
jgi:hypothetical protein